MRAAASATILLAAATSYRHGTNLVAACDATLRQASSLPPRSEAKGGFYSRLRRRHVASHRALFRRVGLELKGPADDTADAEPTRGAASREDKGGYGRAAPDKAEHLQDKAEPVSVVSPVVSSSSVCSSRAFPTGKRVERLGMDCAFPEASSAPAPAAADAAATATGAAAVAGAAPAAAAASGAVAGGMRPTLGRVGDPGLLAQWFHFSR